MRVQRYNKFCIYASIRAIILSNRIKFFVYRTIIGPVCLHIWAKKRSINEAQSAGKIIALLAYIPLNASVPSKGSTYIWGRRSKVLLFFDICKFLSFFPCVSRKFVDKRKENCLPEWIWDKAQVSKEYRKWAYKRFARDKNRSFGRFFLSHIRSND